MRPDSMALDVFILVLLAYHDTFCRRVLRCQHNDLCDSEGAPSSSVGTWVAMHVLTPERDRDACQDQGLRD